VPREKTFAGSFFAVARTELIVNLTKTVIDKEIIFAVRQSTLPFAYRLAAERTDE